jgi:MarR family transcriptional regulator, lower aerobic nicotinate degradation pathway regulator
VQRVTSSKHRVVLTPVPGEGDLGLVDALAQLSFAVQGTLGRIAASYDLSIVQARLLGILRDRSPSIKELSAFLGLDKSSVTGLVDRAEERGLVRRIASPSDGRAAAAFEAEIAVLVADLSSRQQDRLSVAASRVVAADARRRGINVFDSTGRKE